MKKSPIKIAFVVLLSLVFVAGVFLLVQTSRDNSSPDTESRGFLSFFGDRKTRLDDEQVIPGVGTSTAGQSTSGITSGENTSGITGQSTAGGELGTGGTGTTGGAITGGGQGSFSINSIGTNGSQIGGTVGGGSGASNTGIGTTGGGGNSGGFTGGQTTGGTTGAIPQIDCTPPQLPYTQGEIQALQALTNEFYRISANLHTDVDIQNEKDTRKSYYDLFNKTREYTQQCYNQVAVEMKKSATDPTKKAINANARWHPYLTQAVLDKLGGYDPRVKVSPITDHAKLLTEISALDSQINSINAQIDFLESLKNSAYISGPGLSNPNFNSGQQYKLDALKSELPPLLVARGFKQRDYDAIKYNKPIVQGADILGTFFTEAKFSNFDLRVARENINFRRKDLWDKSKSWLEYYDNDVAKYFYDQLCFGNNNHNTVCENGRDIYPLKVWLIDKMNAELYLDDAGVGKTYFNRFQQIEDGLRIW